MSDILFLLVALAMVALVMVPVVAEGIHHTRFSRRRAAVEALASMNRAFLQITVNMTAFVKEVERATAAVRAFGEAVNASGRRYR